MAGQLTPTGAADYSHPKNYGVPQFLDASQSGQNITVLGALETLTWPSSVAPIPHFEKRRPPTISGLSKSAVCSPVIRKELSGNGYYDDFKVDAADMVRFLGPTPSVEANLDKLNSLYGSLSTFEIVMQGFYRE